MLLTFHMWFEFWYPHAMCCNIWVFTVELQRFVFSFQPKSGKEKRKKSLVISFSIVRALARSLGLLAHFAPSLEWRLWWWNPLGAMKLKGLDFKSPNKGDIDLLIAQCAVVPHNVMVKTITFSKHADYLVCFLLRFLERVWEQPMHDYIFWWL